ncbi:MAG TPA: YncE family protein [Gemmatimonadaceae bacterium]|nr:YncE family protein [Gemmatimonadaceae bacterium]
MRRFLMFAAALSVACARSPRAAPGGPDSVGADSAPATEYRAYVVSESADLVSLVRFGPGGARLDHTVKTGLMPAEINGPHGIALSPDGRHYFVTVAHGTPFGTLWKYTTAGDTVVARATLGLYPASLQVSPDGAYAYVANFNVYGDMVPSSVSVVATEQMVEVARITTCTMPHGSRFNREGTRHYSTCMMDDALVEIDTRLFNVARHFVLSAGREAGMAGAPAARTHAAPGATPAAGEGSAHAAHAAAPDVQCSPTWVEPSPDASRVYVACNKSDEIVEIDAGSWRFVRRFPAGPGVYNIAVTRDGRRLLGTNKRGQSVSVIDVATGRELARIPTKRKVVHGVSITPDDRYAFVSVEGIGSEPGTVEIVDLRALATVATVDVGQQAAGIEVVSVAARTATQ